VTARQRLAAAHAAMTPDEIAEHALDLADILDAQTAAIASMRQSVTALIAANEQTVSTLRTFSMAVRRAHSLFAVGLVDEGRAMVEEIAAVSMLNIPSLKESAHGNDG